MVKIALFTLFPHAGSWFAGYMKYSKQFTSHSVLMFLVLMNLKTFPIVLFVKLIILQAY